MAGYGVAGPGLPHQRIGKSWEKLNVATGRKKETEFARAQKLKPAPQFGPVPKQPNFQAVMLPLGN